MDSSAPGVLSLLPPSQILPAPRRSRMETHSRVLRLLINAFIEWLASPNSTKQSQRPQFWKRTLHPEFVVLSAAQEHNTHSEYRSTEMGICPTNTFKADFSVPLFLITALLTASTYHCQIRRDYHQRKLRFLSVTRTVKCTQWLLPEVGWARRPLPT